MRYDTVEIRHNVCKKSWEVAFSQSYEDRQEVETSPNLLGFYHYPHFLGKKQAFAKMKNALVRAHKKEINRLNISLLKLEKLNFIKI